MNGTENTLYMFFPFICEECEFPIDLKSLPIAPTGISPLLFRFFHSICHFFPACIGDWLHFCLFVLPKSGCNVRFLFHPMVGALMFASIFFALWIQPLPSILSETGANRLSSLALHCWPWSKATLHAEHFQKLQWGSFYSPLNVSSLSYHREQKSGEHIMCSHIHLFQMPNPFQAWAFLPELNLCCLALTPLGQACS